MARITYNGTQFDFDAVVNLMDDDLRERLASAGIWSSEQAFFDAYAREHEAKFNAPFVIN